MFWLKQSTEVTAMIGPFLDKTDGVTEETGLASNATEISKNGAAFGAGPTLGTHDGEGYYPVTLTTTHTNTLGRLKLKSHDNATHLPVWHDFMVLPANVYDSLVAGTDLLDVEDAAVFARLGAPQGASHAADILNTMTLIESQRGAHTWQGGAVPIYVGPTTGNDTTGNGSRALPYATVTKALSVLSGRHNIIHLLADNPSGQTTLTEAVTISKAYTFIRGPGRDFLWTRAGNGATITVAADGVELSGFQLESPGASATSYGISVANYDFLKVHDLWINATQGSGIKATNSKRLTVKECHFIGTGASASGHGIDASSTGGSCDYLEACCSHFIGVQGDAIRLSGSGSINDAAIYDNVIMGSTGYGVNVVAATRTAILDNAFSNNASGNISDTGTDTDAMNNEQWAKAEDWTALRASYLDAPISSVGGLSGARAIEITVTDGATGIPNVNVSVYDSTNTVFLGRVECNGSGVVTVNLDDGTYSIRLSRENFEADNPTETLVVTADDSVEYTGALSTVDPVDEVFAGTTRRQRVRYDSDNADNPLRVQLVRDGAKVTPISATITIYAPGNTTALVSAVAMDVQNDVLLYSPDTTTTDDWPIGNGYRAEMVVTTAGTTFNETLVFDVARFILNIPISVDELIARDDSMRNLEHDGGVSFATLIEACRDEIQLELETKAVKDGQLIENMVLDSSRLAVLFRPYVLAAVWSEKRDYDHADRYRKEFSDMLATYLAGVSYDSDQDGEEDTDPGEYKPTRMKL